REPEAADRLPAARRQTDARAREREPGYLVRHEAGGDPGAPARLLVEADYGVYGLALVGAQRHERRETVARNEYLSGRHRAALQPLTTSTKGGKERREFSHRACPYDRLDPA